MVKSELNTIRLFVPSSDLTLDFGLYWTFRFAVRPFKFDYVAVTNRKQDEVLDQITRQNQVIDKWDDLLRTEYGVGYAEIPRYQVSFAS
jgi:hypothetical protein